jgi:molybdopterin-guanine dinucleotide biosynthesis protein A
MQKDGLVVSHLSAVGDQPTFCMIQRGCAERFSETLGGGERRLTAIFERLAGGGHFQWVHEAGELCGYPELAVLERWFLNVNTPEELAEVDRAAKQIKS